MEIHYLDGIGPYLRNLVGQLAGPGQAGNLEEAGQAMATAIGEAQASERGLVDNQPYAAHTKAYAKKVGDGAILHRTGELLDSWRPLVVQKDRVLVGAGGLPLNKIKASAHDGGMARRFKNEKWNRLRIGWNARLLTQVVETFLGGAVTKAAKAPPEKIL